MFLNDIKYNWIGDIPKDWEVKRIKNLFYLKKEVSENPEQEQVLSLTMNGIIKRDVSSNEGQLPDTYKGYTKIYPDDIVMNPMDLKSGWIDRSKYDGIISPSYYVLNKLNDDLEIQFFNYQLQRHYKERIFFSFGQGVSYDYRWGLGRETTLNFPIVVPPLEIQTQIVSFLDTKTQKIDELIEKTEQKIKLLKEKRTSLISHCVTKGLNPNVEMKDSGVEWIQKIPICWNKSRIRMIGKLYGGLTGKKGDDFNNDDNPFNKPFVPFTNIFNNTYISMNQFQYVNIGEGENQNRVLKYDLFFLMSSESYEDLGKCSILLEDVEELYLNSFCKGYRIKDKRVNPLFLNYQLSGSLHKEMISIEGNGFTRINLRQDRLLDIPVFIPPLNEQTQIVEYLDEQTQKIDSIIEKETQRIKLLKEYCQSLISEVVTGKIDVRDWNK